MPARSFLIIFSETSAFCSSLAASKPSSESPPALPLSLWQATQVAATSLFCASTGMVAPAGDGTLGGAGERPWRSDLASSDTTQATAKAAAANIPNFSTRIPAVLTQITPVSAEFCHFTAEMGPISPFATISCIRPGGHFRARGGRDGLARRGVREIRPPTGRRMPFVSVSDTEDRRFIKRAPSDLQADRESIAGIPAADRQARHAGQVEDPRESRQRRRHRLVAAINRHHTFIDARRRNRELRSDYCVDAFEDSFERLQYVA